MIMTQVALITGGARRIGAAIIRLLHQKNYDIVVHFWHSVGEARALTLTLNKLRPNSAICFSGDLREINTHIQLRQQIMQRWGRLDLLVNNASVFLKDRHPDAADQWKINALAPYELTQACRPLLALSTNNPNVINISDIYASNPRKNYTHYCASKAAFDLYSKALAKMLAPQIRVNTLSLGPILWPEGDNELNDAEKKQMIQKTLLKRIADPDMVAKTIVAYACLDGITGDNVHLDCGQSLK